MIKNRQINSFFLVIICLSNGRIINFCTFEFGSYRLLKPDMVGEHYERMKFNNKNSTIMKQKIGMITLLFLSVAFYATSQEIIAHRGYWKPDGSAQNSIASLVNADALKVYGSEVDIWLSSDGIPVVNHDADIMLDGKKVSVQETPAATLRQVKLANGEPMPTVEEYLAAFEKCGNTRLIVEFKTHKKKEAEDELAEKVINMIREKGLQNRVEYISFGINFVNQVRKLDPAAPVYYLNGDLSPRVIKSMGAAGIDYHFNVLKKNPHWVKEAHDLGLKVNVWTVNTPDGIREMLDLKVDFITTDEPLLAGELINKQK